MKEKNYYRISDWESKIAGKDIIFEEVRYSAHYPLRIAEVKGYLVLHVKDKICEKRCKWDNEGRCYINRYRYPQYDIDL